MIDVVPDHLLDNLAAAAPTPEPTRRPAPRATGFGEFDIDSWIARHLPDAIGPVEWRGGRKWVLPVCPFNSDHTNRSAFIVQQQNGALAFGCHHNGCSNHRWRDLRRMLDPPKIHDTVGRIDERDHSSEHSATPEAERFTIRRITSRELDEGEYTTKYLVENMMAELQPLVIAAPLKTLKTTIAVALAIALALGRAFLNKFWVNEAVNVLVLSGESGMGALQSAARRIAASYGFRLGDISRLVWSTDLPRLDNPSHIEEFREALVRDEISVVILDPLYFCLPGADAGNLMIVGGYLRTLNEACNACGVTLVVVHHVKRSTGRDAGTPADLSDISWAGTAEWARQWILLSRRKPYEPNTGQHDLWMVTGGSAGHSGLHALDIYEGVGDDRTWHVEVLDQDHVRQSEDDAKERSRRHADEAKLEGYKKAFVSALLKFPEGETLSAIRDRAGLNNPNATKALAALLEDETVVPCDIFKPNRKTPYVGYRFSEPLEGSYGTIGTNASGQACPTDGTHHQDNNSLKGSCPGPDGGAGKSRMVSRGSSCPDGQFQRGVAGRWEVE